MTVIDNTPLLRSSSTEVCASKAFRASCLVASSVNFLQVEPVHQMILHRATVSKVNEQSSLTGAAQKISR